MYLVCAKAGSTVGLFSDAPLGPYSVCNLEQFIPRVSSCVNEVI